MGKKKRLLILAGIWLSSVSALVLFSMLKLSPMIFAWACLVFTALLLSFFTLGGCASGFTARMKKTIVPHGSDQKPVVLFLTSNGAGLGHLTRVSAVAAELKECDFRILTLSSGFHKLDFPRHKIHYFPSYGNLNMDSETWNKAFCLNLESHMEIYKPKMVVFDGTYIYKSITLAAKRHQIPVWWIQRGCWKEEVDKKSLQRHNASSVCERVILPGDYGCEEKVDLGKGVQSYSVNPIINVDRKVYTKSEAKLTLGFEEEGKYVLIQLGAGNINDTRPAIETAIKEVSKLGGNWYPVILRNPLNENLDIQGAIEVEAFPISSFFTCFEFAVLAAGYNSVQESIALRLPAVFVPNLETSTDDQLRRAYEVSVRGTGYFACDEDSLATAISSLAKAENRKKITEKMALERSATGASEIAKIIDTAVCSGKKKTFL